MGHTGTGGSNGFKKIEDLAVSCIAQYTPDEQRDLLTLMLREIKVWIQQHPLAAQQKKRPSLSTHPKHYSEEPKDFSLPDEIRLTPQLSFAHPTDLQQCTNLIRQTILDPSLSQAECRTGLPLRLLCLSLACLADASGRCDSQDWQASRQLVLPDLAAEQECLQLLVALGKIRLSPGQGLQHDVSHFYRSGYPVWGVA